MKVYPARKFSPPPPPPPGSPMQLLTPIATTPINRTPFRKLIDDSFNLRPKNMEVSACQPAGQALLPLSVELGQLATADIAEGEVSSIQLPGGGGERHHAPGCL